MRWSLDSIYKGFDEDYKKDFKDIDILIDDTLKWMKSELSETTDSIGKTLKLIEKLSAIYNKMDMLVMFPLLMAGGSFFPTETMPEFIVTISKYTPNGHVVEPLKNYLTGEYGSSGMFSGLWGIMLVSLLLVLLAGRLSARKVLS